MLGNNSNEIVLNRKQMEEVVARIKLNHKKFGAIQKSLEKLNTSLEGFNQQISRLEKVDKEK